MFFDKIHLVSYLIFMYAPLVVDCQSGHSFREMCLEKALTIQALLRQKLCPYKYLTTVIEPMRCSVLCRGIFTTKALDPARNCVGYDISFKLNKSLTAKLKDFHCEIPGCLLEVVEFVCTFNGEFADIPLNMTSSNENRECLDSGISTVINLSCLIGGSLIGISILVLVKRLRTYKQRLQPPPVFYQPNYGDGDDLTGERTVTIGSPLETEYADIEETIRMVAKAIQVPSYKEDSSSETRSRENIYHHLSLIEDSTQKKNISFTSSDTIPNSFADDVILSNKSSPSLKSAGICTESMSSQSNGNSKVSPTGSVGSDKYHALEDEYLIANSSNSKI